MKSKSLFSPKAFASKIAYQAWMIGMGVAIIGGTVLRFWNLSNPLVEPHPIRQTQTALTAVLFSEGRTGFLNYESPYQGALWNFVHEFPLYQWLVSIPMRMGVSVEVSSRLFTLLFFFCAVFFFARLVRRFFGETVVPWALLAFLLSPFCIIYSRTCLVDFSALALLLASFEAAFLAVEKPKKPSLKLLSTAFILGSLAAIVKTNLWFSPITAFCIYVAVQFRQRKLPRSAAVWMTGQAVGQLCVALLWIRWTMTVRGQHGVLVGADTQAWILGPFAMRFTLAPWKAIAEHLVRSVWHDWMWIPALFAFFSPYRTHALVCAGICLFSVLMTFNVHAFHDYYLIGETPYLFAMVGAGLAHAFSLLKRPRPYFAAAALGMCAVVIASRIPKLPYYLAPVFHDFRTSLAETYALSELTTKEDLVLVEAQTESWEIPLYSGRDVLLSPYFKAGISPEPSVYRVKKSDLSLYLSAQRDFWVDANDEGFEVVRTEERGKFVQDPSRHLWMGTSLDPMPHPIHVAGPGSHWSTCDGKGAWLELKGLDEHQSIVVVVGDKLLRLPHRPFVYLPTSTPWGCHFQIEPGLRSAASSNTEM